MITSLVEPSVSARRVASPPSLHGYIQVDAEDVACGHWVMVTQRSYIHPVVKLVQRRWLYRERLIAVRLGAEIAGHVISRGWRLEGGRLIPFNEPLQACTIALELEGRSAL